MQNDEKKMKKDKLRVLFLCAHNSCRSQMAEGLLNTIYGSIYMGFSAGVESTKVNQYAVEVMKEIGIDLSKHYSKKFDEFVGGEFDFVITVCDNAKEICPIFPGKNVIHKNFEDPANYNGNIEETRIFFRKVRDEIKDWITKTFGDVDA